MTFVFTSSQAGSTFECALDGLGWSSCASPITYAGLAEGSHLFQVRATRAGRTDPSPAAQSFTVDTVAPSTPVITEHPLDPSSDGNASFAFVAGGTPGVTPEHFECWLDSGAFHVCASSIAYAGLAVGTHVFQVEVVDAAGNRSVPAEFDWVIQTAGGIPPETTIDSGPEGTTNSNAVTFTYSSNVPGSTFECSLDGAPFTPCPATGQSYMGLGDGPHVFEVRATDPDGNTDPTPASRSFVVDTARPDPPLFTRTEPPGPSSSDSPKILGQAEPGSLVVLYTDPACSGAVAATGSAEDFGTSGIRVHVAENSTTTFFGTVTDAAGNVSICSPTGISYTQVKNEAAVGASPLATPQPAPSTTPTFGTAPTPSSDAPPTPPSGAGGNGSVVGGAPWIVIPLIRRRRLP